MYFLLHAKKKFQIEYLAIYIIRKILLISKIKMLKAGVQYDISYDLKQLKNIKERLEVEIGAKICKITSASKIKLICKNKATNHSNCPFQYVFVAYNNKFMLQGFNDQHNQQCKFNEQQASFYKNKNKLINLKPFIFNFLKERHEKYGFQKPKKLIPLISQAMTEFSLYENIKTLEYRRKIKKKFDNIIGQIRLKLIGKKIINEKKQQNHIQNQQKVYLESQSKIQSKQTNINQKQKNLNNKKIRNKKNKSQVQDQLSKQNQLKTPNNNCKQLNSNPISNNTNENKRRSSKSSFSSKILNEYSRFNDFTPMKNFLFYVQTPQKKESLFKSVLDPSPFRFNYNDFYFQQ